MNQSEKLFIKFTKQTLDEFDTNREMAQNMAIVG